MQLARHDSLARRSDLMTLASTSIETASSAGEISSVSNPVNTPSNVNIKCYNFALNDMTVMQDVLHCGYYVCSAGNYNIDVTYCFTLCLLGILLVIVGVSNRRGFARWNIIITPGRSQYSDTVVDSRIRVIYFRAVIRLTPPPVSLSIRLAKSPREHGFNSERYDYTRI